MFSRDAEALRSGARGTERRPARVPRGEVTRTGGLRMVVFLQLAVLCATLESAPDYTVHVRELTAPEQSIKVPLTGSVTVHDAVVSLDRRKGELDRMDLWLLRRDQDGSDRVLRIDWVGIATRGMTATNYQIRAGDRLFLQ